MLTRILDDRSKLVEVLKSYVLIRKPTSLGIGFTVQYVHDGKIKYLKKVWNQSYAKFVEGCFYAWLDRQNGDRICTITGYRFFDTLEHAKNHILEVNNINKLSNHSNNHNGDKITYDQYKDLTPEQLDEIGCIPYIQYKNERINERFIIPCNIKPFNQLEEPLYNAMVMHNGDLDKEDKRSKVKVRMNKFCQRKYSFMKEE